MDKDKDLSALLEPVMMAGAPKITKQQALDMAIEAVENINEDGFSLLACMKVIQTLKDKFK